MTGLIVVGLVGFALLAVAMLSARRHHRPVLDGARHGAAAARDGAPGPRGDEGAAAAAAALFFQTLGWVLQLLAVWVAMRAFDIDAPLPAAGLVLLLMNVATVFPLWPGNIGLLQAAVALPLRQYGVAYATGFAYGLVLQVVEMSVGVGVGLVMLAREGLSFASLQRWRRPRRARRTSWPSRRRRAPASRREGRPQAVARY